MSDSSEQTTPTTPATEPAATPAAEPAATTPATTPAAATSEPAAAPSVFADLTSKDTTKPPPGGDKPWYNSLPEDIRSDPYWQRFRSPEEAFRGHHEAHKLAVKKGLTPPKDVSEYVWPKVTEDDGTERDVFPGLPDGLRGDHAKRLFEQGVPTEMFPGINKAFEASLREASRLEQEAFKQEMDAQRVATVAALRQEYGPVEAERLSQEAQLLVRNLGLDSLTKEFPMLMVRQDFVSAMMKLAQATRESTVLRGQQGSALGVREEINRIRASKAYQDNGHPNHFETRQRLTALYQQLPPGSE